MAAWACCVCQEAIDGRDYCDLCGHSFCPECYLIWADNLPKAPGKYVQQASHQQTMEVSLINPKSPSALSHSLNSFDNKLVRNEPPAPYDLGGFMCCGCYNDNDGGPMCMDCGHVLCEGCWSTYGEDRPTIRATKGTKGRKMETSRPLSV